MAAADVSKPANMKTNDWAAISLILRCLDFSIVHKNKLSIHALHTHRLTNCNNTFHNINIPFTILL